MSFWVINICLVFALSAFLAGILIPQILLISLRKNLYDEPNERKIHHSVVPRLGGIAFKPVIFFSLALLMGVNYHIGRPELLVAAGDDALALSFGFCSILMLYLVGIADDLIGVRYRAKFVALILCGIMLIAGGVWVDNLHGILGIHQLPSWAGFPLSILLIVFIVNAINLIDGIDGLASGLCSVAVIFYGILFFAMGKYIYAMLAFATLGVLVPFFYYNVFGKAENGKKIFMGDTGSLTIGLILCFISIKLTSLLPTGETNALNPFVVAFSPLLIPCFDTVQVFFLRVRAGKNPFLPDMNHIHHRMLAAGMRQRTAMLILLSVAFAFTASNAVLSAYINVNLLLLGDILVWIAANHMLAVRTKRRRAKLPEPQSQPEPELQPQSELKINYTTTISTHENQKFY